MNINTSISQRILRRLLLGFSTFLLVIGLSSLAVLGRTPDNRYVLSLTPDQVMPKAPTTNARGEAKARLMGERLMVEGKLRDLSSPLRDYTTDPANPPNPNITSGVHIHRGERSENGPFQYALTVNVGREGAVKFRGEYTLTEEQLQALQAGRFYLDVHTQQNRTGELRGVFQPA